MKKEFERVTVGEIMVKVELSKIALQPVKTSDREHQPEYFKL